MKITEREENGIVVYVLEGRIDSEGAATLDQTLRAGFESGTHKMVLDLTRVPYINSAALRTLADITSRNREKGGDLRLAALDIKVKRVLQIVGFDQFSTFYDTVEDALANF
jgi:anti-sigma B factor antagonist